MLSAQGFDLWADGYDQSVGLSDEENTYPFAGYKDVLGRIYREVMVRGGGDVLDIGFGTGVLTQRLYQSGCRIWGQDFSPRMVEVTQRKLPGAKLYCGSFADGLAPELRRQRYDAILATYSLHHLTDAEKAAFVGILMDQLKPGGVLMIGDVAFENRAALEACREEAGEEWDEEEIYFVADEWRALMPGRVRFEQISHCAGVITMEKEPLDLAAMQRMQQVLQARHFARWGGLSPAKAREKLLWMMIEAGEMADVIKKQGDEAILHDETARRHFIEEACDTLMYLNDIMLCYGVTPEEMETVYHEKHQRNLGRWQERNEPDV